MKFYSCVSILDRSIDHPIIHTHVLREQTSTSMSPLPSPSPSPSPSNGIDRHPNRTAARFDLNDSIRDTICVLDCRPLCFTVEHKARSTKREARGKRLSPRSSACCNFPPEKCQVLYSKPPTTHSIHSSHGFRNKDMMACWC